MLRRLRDYANSASSTTTLVDLVGGVEQPDTCPMPITEVLHPGSDRSGRLLHIRKFGDGVMTVRVEPSVGRRLRISRPHVPDATIELNLETGGGLTVRFQGDAVDMSHDPRGAVGAVLGVADTLVEDGVLSYLASAVPDTDLSSISPAAAMVAQLHPVLVAARHRWPTLDIPPSVPLAVSPLLRKPTLRDAIQFATGERTAVTSPLIRAVADRLVLEDTLQLGVFSVLSCGAGLEPDTLARLVAETTPPHPFDVTTGQGVAEILATLGPSTHADVVRVLGSSTSAGRRVLLALEPAQLSGRLDLAGVRDASLLGSRVMEALAPDGYDQSAVPLHGRPSAVDGLVWRQLRSAPEFRDAGSRMGNCLATYGPNSAAAGAVIVVARGQDGVLRHAIEVRSGRVVTWEGPRRSTANQVEQRILEGDLAAAGLIAQPGQPGLPRTASTRTSPTTSTRPTSRPVPTERVPPQPPTSGEDIPQPRGRVEFAPEPPPAPPAVLRADDVLIVDGPNVDVTTGELVGNRTPTRAERFNPVAARAFLDATSGGHDTAAVMFLNIPDDNRGAAKFAAHLQRKGWHVFERRSLGSRTEADDVDFAMEATVRAKRWRRIVIFSHDARRFVPLAERAVAEGTEVVVIGFRGRAPRLERLEGASFVDALDVPGLFTSPDVRAGAPASPLGPEGRWRVAGEERSASANPTERRSTLGGMAG